MKPKTNKKINTIYIKDLVTLNLNHYENGQHGV